MGNCGLQMLADASRPENPVDVELSVDALLA
jgi:hypothetical protein